MHTDSRFPMIAACALALLALAGCPTNDSMTNADAGVDSTGVDSMPVTDPTPDAGAAIDTGPPPSDPGKPLAYGCAADSECASGFCVDGVCCDTRCDQQCALCNATGSAGHCSAQVAGDDSQAAVACAGAHTCGLAGCKLRNQQRCSAGADCASGNCATFYEDLDGDSYGSSNVLKLCESPGASTPPGYSVRTGDCCDTDRGAFPGQTTYFNVQDACGSWDYSCDGKVETSNVSANASYCGKTLNTGCTACNVAITCH